MWVCERERNGGDRCSKAETYKSNVMDIIYMLKIKIRIPAEIYHVIWCSIRPAIIIILTGCNLGKGNSDSQKNYR